jgi:hypothetical protein
MIKSSSIRRGRSFEVFAFLALTIGALFPTLSYGQEIEARTYSNAPIGINFLSAGVVQAKTNNYS